MAKLTKKECEELAGLIQLIDVISCFGVRDCLRRDQLECRATDEQFHKAMAEAYGGVVLDE